MKSYLQRKPIFLGSIIVALIVVGSVIAYLQSGGNDAQTLVIQPGEFVQEVSVSGTVVAADDVDLSFAETGRVDAIYVHVGDKVARGQALAILSIGTLSADLKAAYADLALKKAEAANKAANVQEVRRQQDTLVQNAYREMLSDDLEAVPSLSAVDATPPTITGLYRGKEGIYKIRVLTGPQLGMNDYQLRTTGLEDLASIDILEDDATPLGSNGLFLTFSDALSAYSETTWYITIPNVKSASYRANFNAYQDAQRTRDKEISSAEAEVASAKGITTVSEAEIARAEANVSRIQVQIADRTIRAPFTGTITDVQAKLGGIATANAPAVSLISEATLQVESYVPEINIPFVEVGDPAVITLDAYGADVPFDAKVIFIDPAETVRDGVSTYRIKLEFTTYDVRIRAGMTANITITTKKKSGVVMVPQGIVGSRDGKKFVFVKEGDQVIEREVMLGSVSSLGQIEIVSGLQAGDIVVLSSSD
ncbi:hypothetical protein A3G63_00580 [Candidatus Kaiserbacteria bacterium RIFCSPLOWO2_12_FULL_52_8]|uniref:Membrane fusion protein biotin-lipoyl like domain-containing protein n=1 Tax=Candidatus Kaiserbacteria bacterium RIFCSPHIGHO2_01_FULL_53_31 TaxID=1798481 RepID=A0A1F6CJJ9_9BACT|nr:MAG: hypothetical protein A2678_01130 [Candidatus Kaiserbacteria bacterium RIFCSPHIGHO2_01_FULL_53_31]OGG92657.1 MAG: hypothetical protein A3G63_00580 [Candidatus Kaiserbacteria bacterium RIFCSPLOWO2_12_FULL_52_8]